MQNIKIFPGEIVGQRKVIYTLCEATPEDVKNSPRKLSSRENCGQKKVVCMTLEGEMISIHNSLKLASETRAVSASSISLACNGKLKTAGGYKWKWLEPKEK